MAGGALPHAALATATGGGDGGASLGLIDGGVVAHPALAGRVEQRGFAKGAPSASRHGTAVASLLIGTGAIRGAAPGQRLLAADVYGTDAAGGNASAIARALGWLVQSGVAVTTISLVGPDNKLLAAAVARAQQRGMLIVAAVGNDGPAAPPAYPASYRGVLAVTGVDAKGRALPEAGRALHVDFAAPGDNVLAATGAVSTDRLRGTSFAAPLVAGRLVRLYPAPAIDRIGAAIAALVMEARDLGKPGRDKVYGHGLICGTCGGRMTAFPDSIGIKSTAHRSLLRPTSSGRRFEQINAQNRILISAAALAASAMIVSAPASAQLLGASSASAATSTADLGGGPAVARHPTKVACGGTLGSARAI